MSCVVTLDVPGTYVLSKCYQVRRFIYIAHWLLHLHKNISKQIRCLDMFRYVSLPRFVVSIKARWRTVSTTRQKLGSHVCSLPCWLGSRPISPSSLQPFAFAVSSPKKSLLSYLRDLSTMVTPTPSIPCPRSASLLSSPLLSPANVLIICFVYCLSPPNRKLALIFVSFVHWCIPSTWDKARHKRSS